MKNDLFFSLPKKTVSTLCLDFLLFVCVMNDAEVAKRGQSSMMCEGGGGGLL